MNYITLTLLFSLLIKNIAYAEAPGSEPDVWQNDSDYSAIDSSTLQNQSKEHKSIFDKLINNFLSDDKNSADNTIDNTINNNQSDLEQLGFTRNDKATITVIDKITGKKAQYKISSGGNIQHQNANLYIGLVYCWESNNPSMYPDARGLFLIHKTPTNHKIKDLFWIFSQYPASNTFQDARYEIILNNCG